MSGIRHVPSRGGTERDGAVRVPAGAPANYRKNTGVQAADGGVAHDVTRIPVRRGGGHMLMADTMAVFFVIVGLMVSLVGLWLLARGLWPSRVAFAAERFDRGLLFPFVAGLPITLTVLVVAAVVSNLPGKAGGIGAGAILCAYCAFASVGVSGLATSIGRRLASALDADNPWRATLRGAVVLVASCLVPVLGWFGVLPIAVVAGAGAATLALVPRRADKSVAAAVPVAAPQV